ncbi:hypothetical protein CQW49_01805 [Methylosinus trichosporium OB3b]|uniref:Uncharacterized protein n=2 Tax=Methylosinus TaxID=425 RepID=A0A2D2CVK6_METT3|nr:hypothetical protein CQW49_01805 [Methylosinus trichosporium OB3b]OBS51430.1 hypothetical protein A8B73_16480 [Methylosinus sp. 3S-1]
MEQRLAERQERAGTASDCVAATFSDSHARRETTILDRRLFQVESEFSPMRRPVGRDLDATRAAPHVEPTGDGPAPE